MGDRDRLKWDARYSTSDYIYGAKPAPLLLEQRDRLPDGGRALDIACGEGQNSVHLASQGFDVLATDISTVGLRKAKALAEEHNVQLRLELRDIERSLLPEGPFELIVCIHYKQQTLSQAITECLAPGGLS